MRKHIPRLLLIYRYLARVLDWLPKLDMASSLTSTPAFISSVWELQTMYFPRSRYVNWRWYFAGSKANVSCYNDIMALRSYSVLDILLPPILIMMQDCSQALSTCKCLWSLSCGGVFNMLLLLSITFHYYYNIWGCMCSTGPFQFRWLKGYIYSSCYYNHQIGENVWF